MKIESMIVLTLPPSNEPFIFTSSAGGLIYCMKPDQKPIAFGAHNDGIPPNHSKFPPGPKDAEICLLLKNN